MVVTGSSEGYEEGKTQGRQTIGNLGQMEAAGWHLCVVINSAKY